MSAFITGVLRKNDVNYQVAKALASVVIAERAFQPISEEPYHKACKKLASCSEVINCLTQYGEMNFKNRELAQRALSNSAVE